MSETQDVKRRGTGWIIGAAVAYAICLLQLVTTPFAIAGGSDGAYIGGKVFAVVLFALLGTGLLLLGLRRRRA